MINIPPHISSLKNYKPGKAKGVDEDKVLQQTILCSNENNLGPSPLVVSALPSHLSGLHQYPDPTASRLRKVLAEKLNRVEEEIFVSSGSDHILYLVFKAYFSEGENLVTSEGTFVSIDPMAAMNQVSIKKIQLTPMYGFDIEGIINAIDSKTKAIYICNPNNPTGTIITQSQMQKLIDDVPDHVMIIIDEAYYEYADSLHENYPQTLEHLKDNMLVLRTFSKAYGLAGIRLGYGIATAPLLSGLWKVKPTFMPGNLALEAGRIALNDSVHLDKTIRLNKKMVYLYYRLFKELGLKYIPTGANFVTLVFEKEEEAIRFTAACVEGGVLVRHLTAFGLPQMVRISTGTEKDFLRLSRALSQIMILI